MWNGGPRRTLLQDRSPPRELQIDAYKFIPLPASFGQIAVQGGHEFTMGCAVRVLINLCWLFHLEPPLTLKIADLRNSMRLGLQMLNRACLRRTG
ncbi:hypothetical protein BD309DRAFT_588522 [Dichomitus squalens]|uniref:Uncharacterized protein n=2 Tax=Dichomitus squalens TaxID=114155 RepID=A0A4Q9N1H6_9APHY|nr:uncharacterized protein DICSQDRAFT_156133 [Dichomitus squalens LYAD-421 SS1]EJF59803.1 hypothetical protein DICSQDRAFT_156133 [Dichomitus squalens LYAD-421 SS1]TBU34330.1 hypothetical protein BD311DRAFT_350936 [Dichomitus squalens]TBU46709.1 hypothetical protein BD309DRAFT_588522 [Dichomitus squalens]TBU57499.1 hypothetical protein BD310DRAFT_929181 [Dichomitus squalens]